MIGGAKRWRLCFLLLLIAGAPTLQALGGALCAAPSIAWFAANERAANERVMKGLAATKQDGGPGDRIRTCGLWFPKPTRYQTALRPDRECIRENMIFEKKTDDSKNRRVNWWSLSGSNRRPPACKAGALPSELRPHILFLLVDCCGAGEGIRTPDPLITSQVLYHLSYTGIWMKEGAQHCPHFVHVRTN